jgi:seryl-tRNA synthetase
MTTTPFNPFDGIIAEIQRNFSAANAELSKLQGIYQRQENLQAQARDLAEANRQAADDLAAARALKSQIDRQIAEQLAAAKSEAESVKADAKSFADRKHSEASESMRLKQQLDDVVRRLSSI